MSNIPKMVVAVKGVIVHENKILIVKRSYNDDFGGGTWECPGGKMEFGEDIEEALKREVKEEVGVEISVENILYATTFHTHPTRQLVILMYLCKCENTQVTLSNEHTDFKWCNIEEIKELLSGEIIRDFEKHDVFSMIHR